MDNRSFWNDVAKYGLLLGIAMGASKVFEQALIIYGGFQNVGWVILDWILFAAIFMVVLYKATKRQSDQRDRALGYPFFKGANYMILISIFASVPVTCIYYVFINSFVGYDNYIDGLITALVNLTEAYPVDDQTLDTVEMVIKQLETQSLPSIFSVLYNTIFQYAFAGLLAGLALAGFTARRAERVVDNE